MVNLMDKEYLKAYMHSQKHLKSEDTQDSPRSICSLLEPCIAGVMLLGKLNECHCYFREHKFALHSLFERGSGVIQTGTSFSA